MTIADAARDPPALAAWLCILLLASLLYDIVAVAAVRVAAVARERPLAAASSCGFLLFAIAALFGWYRSAFEGPSLVLFLLSLLAYALIVLALHTAASGHDAALPASPLPKSPPTVRPAPLRVAHPVAATLEALRPPAPGDVVALRSGGPPMTISAIASGAPDAVLLWFERGRCLEVKLPLAALSSCRPLWHAEWHQHDRPALYAIDAREVETPDFPRDAEPDTAQTVVARLAPPELVPGLGPVASAG